MNITDTQARKIVKSLYNVAEKDKNDIIANAASALAVRLEFPKKAHALNEIDIRIIQYAISNFSHVEEKKTIRKTYKRRVSLA